MQNQAQLLLVQGRFGEALAAFEADLQHRPGDVGALFGRATALKHLGRHAEARADFDAVLAANPNAAGARNNRGDTLRSWDFPPRRWLISTAPSRYSPSPWAGI